MPDTRMKTLPSLSGTEPSPNSSSSVIKGAPISAKFGTFKGVFTPSLLTILGVIMYLRFGWVVGNAGIVGTVVVVLLAHVISFTTGLSISSIATNRSIRAGGDYYMISRSLGLPAGGAIGLSLFFALSLSTSLYIIGFTESLVDYFGIENSLLTRQIIGSISCFALTSISYFSTSLALRVQYFVLVAILLSLVSLFIGKPLPTASSPALWFPPGAESFEVVFAVFFPAVTGFTTGVAMSGDLKDPRRSIPRGTMLAIVVGLLVYLAIPLFLGITVDIQTLRNDQMVWLRVARIPQLVIAGIFAATLSSALGSLLGAPRYLQALALDGVVPRFLGKGYGPLNEPRFGTAVTFIVAEVGIIVGELNLIARLITMFFLTSYGFACLACGIQTWSGIPSFRPSFRTPAWVSAVGAFSCLAVMFKVDAMAMAAATLAMGGIFLVLRKRESRVGPVDNWQGFWSAVVQKGLLYLHRRTPDGKNWRPNAIVFGGDPVERRHLIDLASWLFSKSGLTTYFNLMIGDLETESRRARIIEPRMQEIIKQLDPEIFARVLVTRTVYDGILGVAQAYGISGLVPNTVMLGWGEETSRPELFTEMVRGLIALDRNLLFLNYHETRAFGERRSIDIWWGGKERNAELMLLLGYLLKAGLWKDAVVRTNVVINEESQVEIARERLGAIVKETRLDTFLNVVERRGRDIHEVMLEESSKTDLVLIGLRQPTLEEGGDYVKHVNSFLNGLGTVLFVRASSNFDTKRLLHDEE